jgi:hypothetical protein
MYGRLLGRYAAVGRKVQRYFVRFSCRLATAE